MSIKDYLEQNNLTLRHMAEATGVHYSTLYRLSLPRNHKSSRRVSLDIAQKIIKGTNNIVALEDLLKIE
jgi:hypothetical protein